MVDRKYSSSWYVELCDLTFNLVISTIIYQVFKKTFIPWKGNVTQSWHHMSRTHWPTSFHKSSTCHISCKNNNLFCSRITLFFKHIELWVNPIVNQVVRGMVLLFKTNHFKEHACICAESLWKHTFSLLSYLAKWPQNKNKKSSWYLLVSW